MIQVGMFNMPPPPIPQGKPPPPGVGTQQFQPLSFKPFKAPDGEFDGKRLRKSVMRKTVDYNCSVVNMLENRVWQRDERDRCTLQADVCYASEILPPIAYPVNPINAVVTKFVRTSTNKAKCPIFCLAWTPEGRRLVTGASSGEFTLWNGLTFNFETILQAHDSSVRTMVWSHNDQWMVTGDTGGFVKYWQTNMNNVKLFQAHKDPVRGLSFSPSDQKFATGSDDGTVRIWDFYRCYEEKILRGHGADVKCVDWHPSKSLLASGSKDNQQPIKLWDPRSGQPLAKLHAHKSTVMDLKWNANGNWLCSASRDHLLKLFDIRNLSTEFQVFRGHKKEASCIGWHPHHEGLFASGGSDGSILFWHVGNDKEVGAIESAHDGIIWDLAWHPLGHILCSGSNDHTSKFWTRNRPGDKMRDKYNLNTLPAGVLADDSMDIDDIPIGTGLTSQGVIPGMGPEDKVEEAESTGPETIPGLDFDSSGFDRFSKKTPYAKPIPKTFQAAWNAAGGLDEEMEEENSATSWVVTDSAALFSLPANIEGELVYTDDGDELPAGSVPLNTIKANSILYCGFLIPLEKVSGDVIQKAFTTMEEEEAIAEVTGDYEFARKLIKEKNQLLNPNASTEESTEKKTGGFQQGQFSEPNPQPTTTNTNNNSSNNFITSPRNFGTPRGNFRNHSDAGFNRGGQRGAWPHRGNPRGGYGLGMSGSRFTNEHSEQGYENEWSHENQNNGDNINNGGGERGNMDDRAQSWGRGRGRGRGRGGFKDFGNFEEDERGNWGRPNHWRGRGGMRGGGVDESSGGRGGGVGGMGIDHGGGGGGGDRGGDRGGGGSAWHNDDSSWNGKGGNFNNNQEGGWDNEEGNYGGHGGRGVSWRGRGRSFRGGGDFQYGGRGGRGDFQRGRSRGGDFQRGRSRGGPPRGRGRGEGGGGWDNFQ
ncbi:uncharacterized protein Wdr33 [Procambarus clarkii]|uniref:uncharacterized protein Wdr33 n=1 Tax=Procambarus clarkii TaxID=6728 RepID=UPI001E670D2C|nr:uncharacterized protein LOC123763527 [Procambarus clarkii]